MQKRAFDVSFLSPEVLTMLKQALKSAEPALSLTLWSSKIPVLAVIGKKVWGVRKELPQLVRTGINYYRAQNALERKQYRKAVEHLLEAFPQTRRIKEAVRKKGVARALLEDVPQVLEEMYYTQKIKQLKDRANRLYVTPSPKIGVPNLYLREKVEPIDVRKQAKSLLEIIAANIGLHTGLKFI